MFFSLFDRLPFDWKNPYGYVIIFIMDYITAFYVMSIMVCQTSLIIGSYWLLISLAKDLSRDLYKINATKMNRLQFKREIINFIQYQSDAKRLSEHWFPFFSLDFQHSSMKFKLFFCFLELFRIFWKHMNSILRFTFFVPFYKYAAFFC